MENKSDTEGKPATPKEELESAKFGKKTTKKNDLATSKKELESGKSVEKPSNETVTAETKPWYKSAGFIGAAVGTAVGAGAAVVAAPLVIGALGIGAGSTIAGSTIAGSLAAQAMSAPVIASGGGFAAGGLVASLQSIGAVGLSLAGWLGVGAAGAAAGSAVGGGTGAIVDLATRKADGGEREKEATVEENEDEGEEEEEEEEDDDDDEGEEKDEKPDSALKVLTFDETSGIKRPLDPDEIVIRGRSRVHEKDATVEEDAEEDDEEGEGKLETELKVLTLNETSDQIGPVGPNEVIIRVSMRGRIDQVFTALRQVPLQKVFEIFLKIAGLEPGSVQFTFADRLLLGSETPAELCMDSGDALVALSVQC